jgi:hypothetical protein
MRYQTFPNDSLTVMQEGVGGIPAAVTYDQSQEEREIAHPDYAIFRFSMTFRKSFANSA